MCMCCKPKVFRHSIAAVTLRERNKVTRAPKASVKSYSAYRHITDNILKMKSKEIPKERRVCKIHFKTKKPIRCDWQNGNITGQGVAYCDLEVGHPRCVV